MAERSYVWDGILVGDATIAPYSTSEWAELQRNLVGASRNDYGVLAGTGNGTQLALEVQATGPASAAVSLFAGAALVNGRLYINDATLTLSIGANASGNTRIDTVIIRRDTLAQTARAIVKQGTPAASPVPATLQQDATTWEIPVAYITVANGFATITQPNIANCEQIIGGNAQQYTDDLLNNSGGRLETGDIVIWDVTTARAVTTSTTANDPLTAGVWVGSTANRSRGSIQIAGFGWVKVIQSATIAGTIGRGLVASGAAKVAIQALAFYRTSHGIGRAMETMTTGGSTLLILAYIQVQTHAALYAQQQEFVAAGGSPGGINSGAWVTRNLIATNATLLPGVTVNAAADTFTVAANTPTAFHWRVPGYKVGTHSSRLFDTTAAGGYDGTVERCAAAADVQTWSEGYKELSAFVGTEVFRIEQQVGTTNGTDGKGIAEAAWQTVGGVPFSTVEVWQGWS